MKSFILLSLLIFLNISCSNFYYHPTKKIYITPDKLGRDFVDFSFKNKEGLNIASWKILSNGKNRKNLIVQFHGNAENMSSHMRSLIWLTKHNFDLITYDYRGYGESDGVPSPLAIREDSILFLNKVYEEFKKDKYEKLILIGQSLGGAVLMDALSFFEKRHEVDLLVLDSTFASYKSVGMRVLQKSWITYLFSPLSYVIASNETAPIKRMEFLKMPKLVIHADGDPVVDFSEGKDLYESLTSPKEFWKIKSKSHIRVFFLDNKKFREKFISFINYLKVTPLL